MDGWWVISREIRSRTHRVSAISSLAAKDGE